MFTQKDIFEYKKKEAGTEFKPPKSLYKFIESFIPGNYLQVKKYLDLCLKEDSPDMILASLSFHLKDLVMEKHKILNHSYPAWRVAKIKNQSDKFLEKELRDMINFLALADIKNKSGKGSVTDLLDLFILKKLNSS